MSKKAFFIILVLSVVVNEVALYVDAILRDSLVAGEGGIPLRFSSGSFLGGSSINYLNFSIDIIFWFVIMWLIWKALSSLLRK